MTRRRSVGVMKGRSEERTESMRDEVVESFEKKEEDSSLDAVGEVIAPKETKGKQKRKRNHRIPIDYFRAMDDILADAYTKQKAAFDVVNAFTRMMESRGIDAPFDDQRFEKAAQNMAVVGMIREMSWLFGLPPSVSDRIVDHTVDQLFERRK